MRENAVIIDGSHGEGGGQVLRTSLSLSLLTSRPLHIQKIRAGRAKPGLMRQHLTAVAAAARIANAEVTGDRLGSRELSFRPQGIFPGRYRFSVGTAGSATLVLQTILPALFVAEKRSQVTVEGGTHNPLAPPFEFLSYTFLPIVNAQGPTVTSKLTKVGFYPRGGGCIEAAVEPASQLAPVEILRRGKLLTISARALVARLPRSIGEREVRVIKKHLGKRLSSWCVEEFPSAPGPGNALIVVVESEALTEVISAIGRRGLPAEKVAEKAAAQTERYLCSEAPVGPHLADQLLLPLSIAGRGRFRTVRPTSHTTTNARVIRKFLPVEISFRELEEDLWEVEIQRREDRSLPCR